MVHIVHIFENLWYFIPDNELHAFEVECQFTAEEGRTLLKPEDWRQEGFTFPKTEEERCTDPNCFSHDFKYPASPDQLKVRELFNRCKFYAGFHVFHLGVDWSIGYMPADSKTCLLVECFDELIILDRPKWSPKLLLEWRKKCNW